MNYAQRISYRFTGANATKKNIYEKNPDCILRQRFCENALLLLPGLAIFNMTVADFRVSKCRVRRDLQKSRGMWAQSQDMHEELVVYAVDSVNWGHMNIRKMITRTKHVKSSSFNTKLPSEQHYLIYISFKREEVANITNIIEWNSVTRRN